MNEQILIKDGVKYKLWDYNKNEPGEFEPIVKKYIKHIFGKNSLYFDVKKLIGSVAGEQTIPDGYLIDFNTNEFYLVEMELSTHSEYDHINKQIGKFNKALSDYNTRRKIASILKEYVEADIVKEKFVRDRIGKKELYQFFLEEVLEKVKGQKYSVVVVIDKKTPKIKDACNILSPKPEIRQFKTFVREGTKEAGKPVYAHLFEPLFAQKEELDKKKIEEPAKGINRVEIELYGSEVEGGPSWRKYGVIGIPQVRRNLFPPPGEKFTLETDIGKFERIATEWMTFTSKPWFDAHPDLKAGDKLVIEPIEPNKRYRIKIVKA